MECGNIQSTGALVSLTKSSLRVLNRESLSIDIRVKLGLYQYHIELGLDYCLVKFLKVLLKGRS